MGEEHSESSQEHSMVLVGPEVSRVEKKAALSQTQAAQHHLDLVSRRYAQSRRQSDVNRAGPTPRKIRIIEKLGKAHGPLVSGDLVKHFQCFTYSATIDALYVERIMSSLWFRIMRLGFTY